MSRLHRLAVVASALLLSAPLAAQPLPPLPSPDSSAGTHTTAPQVIARTAAAAADAAYALAPASSAFRLHAAAAPADARAVPIPARTQRNTAMMLVGGAGMIVGAVVGGDEGSIIMVAGGVIGLIGLWNYLK